jgi:hypothetical protein
MVSAGNISKKPQVGPKPTALYIPMATYLISLPLEGEDLMRTILLSVLLVIPCCATLAGLCPKSHDMQSLLFADEPAPKYKEQLMLFGQFVGDWEFDGVAYDADGTRSTDTGEIHFAWVLQGRAIQDLWIERKVSDERPKVYGSTMRFYDPTIDAWRITWTEPGYGVVTLLIGRKLGDEIVLEGKNSDGKLIHWIFSQIKPDSFHWRGEKLIGEKWQIYEELDAQRQK